MRKPFVILALILTLPTLAGSAGAQPVADHLKCYKLARDPQTRTTYTADLGGLVAEPGCRIRVPAEMACVPSTKVNVTPMPPGGGGTGTPNSFFCYKVQCPRVVLPTITGADQFGSRIVTPGTAKLLCAPLASTTTTSTTLPPGCGNGVVDAGEECDGGPCCDSLCRFKPANTFCYSYGCSVGQCAANVCTGTSAICPNAKAGMPCEPNPPDPCKVYYCGGGQCFCDSSTPAPAGTPCNGGGQCDGAGVCVTTTSTSSTTTTTTSSTTTTTTSSTTTTSTSTTTSTTAPT